MHLEADEVFGAAGALGAAEVVLAGGEQDAGGAEFAEAVHEEADRGDLADGVAAEEGGAAAGGFGEDGFIEDAAGKAGGLARQGRAGGGVTVDEADGGDGGRAEGGGVDAEVVEGGVGLPADELATDLVRCRRGRAR